MEDTVADKNLPEEIGKEKKKKVFLIALGIVVLGVLVAFLVFGGGRFLDVQKGQEGAAEDSAEEQLASDLVLSLPRGVALVTPGIVEEIAQDFITIRVLEESQRQGIPSLITGLITSRVKVQVVKKDKDGNYSYAPATLADVKKGDSGWFTRDAEDLGVERFRLLEVDILR